MVNGEVDGPAVEAWALDASPAPVTTEVARTAVAAKDFLKDELRIVLLPLARVAPQSPRMALQSLFTTYDAAPGKALSPVTCSLQDS